VNDFYAIGLQDAAHDVDGRVMSIKQAGSGDEADLLGCVAVGVSDA
jgi:hypothetical protein